MLKDGNQYELTKDEAIRLHIKMWTDMMKELGDNPSPGERSGYKEAWLIRHGYENVFCDCFLCEHAFRTMLANGEWPSGVGCDRCQIDWSSLSGGSFGRCYERYKYGGDDIHLFAPITEILALPERKVNGR